MTEVTQAKYEVFSELEDVPIIGFLLYFSHVPSFTQVYKWVSANLMLRATLRCTSIQASHPARCRNFQTRFIATETWISYGGMVCLACRPPAFTLSKNLKLTPD